jgi:hypothetical protein
LVFFDTTPGSTTPRDPYEPYTATVNGTRFSAHGGGVGAFHVLLFLNRSGQTLVSLSDRYAVRLTHRAFSAGLFNDGGEYFVELLDGGGVAESAVMSSITTPEFFPFVSSLVMVCVGCATDDSGQGLIYANVANYGLPFFGSDTTSLSENFCCFGAGTVQLRGPCVLADAISGVSSVTFTTVGFRGRAGSTEGTAAIAHASAFPGPLHSVAAFAPDTTESKLARYGTAVGALQSRSRIAFAAAGGAQGVALIDSAGHPEAARPFAFATNATVPADVAFVRPNVAWRSNLSPSHYTNQLLSQIEITTPRFFTRFNFAYRVSELFSATLPPPNIIYSADNRLRVGHIIVGGLFAQDTQIVAINGPFAFTGVFGVVFLYEVVLSKNQGDGRQDPVFGSLEAQVLVPDQETVVADSTDRGNNEYYYQSGQYFTAAEIALREVVEGNSFDTISVSGVVKVRVQVVLAVGSGSGNATLTPQQVSDLFAGQPVTLPIPSGETWESGLVIRAVG